MEGEEKKGGGRNKGKLGFHCLFLHQKGCLGNIQPALRSFRGSGKCLAEGSLNYSPIFLPPFLFPHPSRNNGSKVAPSASAHCTPQTPSIPSKKPLQIILISIKITPRRSRRAAGSARRISPVPSLAGEKEEGAAKRRKDWRGGGGPQQSKISIGLGAQNILRKQGNEAGGGRKEGVFLLKIYSLPPTFKKKKHILKKFLK